MKTLTILLLLCCGQLPTSDFPIEVGADCLHNGLSVIHHDRWLECYYSTWTDRGAAP